MDRTAKIGEILTSMKTLNLSILALENQKTVGS
jgi:hypothetical protein